MVRRTGLRLVLGSILGDCYSIGGRCIHLSAIATQNGAAAGLYGIDHLKTPKGFRRFVDEAIERSVELLTFISNSHSPSEIIHTMDEISEIVCSVADSAELCRHTHPDREFVDEANKASMRINEYLHEKSGFSSKDKKPFISFVLGGPGSGKGTQCLKIAENFGFTHLSAGDLLRREIASNSENGTMLLSTIAEGKIVPSKVTVELIQREIESSDNYKFLIDGFPRTEENRLAFEQIVGMEPNFVLFFDCPEDEMVKRVLNRNQGRVDDNIETMKKRLKIFTALNLPVIRYYAEKGKLYKINAVGTEDEVFEHVSPIFASFEKHP